MPDTLTRCRTCRALANPAWLTCAACNEPLSGEVKSAPHPSEWLSAWRRLAESTHGIIREDPSFEPIMAVLGQCDEAYLAGDWITFCNAAAEVIAMTKK